MKTFTLSLCLFATLPSAEVAPPPRAVTPAYFPTTIGSKWTYLWNGGEESHEVTDLVRVADGLEVTVLTQYHRDMKTKSKFRINKNGLYQLTGGLGPDGRHPPMHLLKLPHRDGQKWFTFLGAWGLGDNGLVSSGPEKVKVPAGTFEAIRVDTRFPSRTDGDGTLAQYWYVEGIGLVKRTYGDNAKVLKSFSVGK
jgi:hypothetical protein